MRETFRAIAEATGRAAGSPPAFALAVGVIVVWAVTGPVFGFSNTWQLVINTGTTIVTFLMVFLLQNTQNREERAVQLKLDELLRALSRARSSMIDIEELSDEDLDKLEEEFAAMNQRVTREKGTRHQGRKKSSGASTKRS